MQLWYYSIDYKHLRPASMQCLQHGIGDTDSTATMYNSYSCTLLLRNQRFYRQITSYERDGAVSEVDQS